MKLFNACVSMCVGFGMYMASAYWLLTLLAIWLVSLKISGFMALLLYFVGVLPGLAIAAGVGYLAFLASTFTINLLSEWSIWCYKKIKGDKTYQHPTMGRIYDMSGGQVCNQWMGV